MTIAVRLSAVACILSGLLLVAGQARAGGQRMPVSSLQASSDQDRETARSQARDAAESSLVCLGALENVRTTVNCARLGDGDGAQWLCTATSTGTCIIGG